MKVRFEFTLGDLVDASERTLARSSIVRRWRLQGAAVCGLLGGLVAWLTRPDLVYAITWGVVLGAAYPFLAERTRKARMLRYFKERFGGYGPYICEVELLPEGLATTQSGVRTVREWSNIERVEDTNDAIEFVTRGSGTVVVRNRAFKSKDEWRQFFDLARGYIRK